MARGNRTENHPNRKVDRSSFDGVGLAGAISRGIRNSVAGGKTDSEFAEYNDDQSAHVVKSIAAEMDRMPGVTRIK
jgi:hypothetical protein